MNETRCVGVLKDNCLSVRPDSFVFCLQASPRSNAMVVLYNTRLIKPEVNAGRGNRRDAMRMRATSRHERR